MSGRPRIPWANPSFDELARRYVVEALDSTWVSHGPFVERFEREFNAHIGSPFGVTTSNGTTALEVALLALDIGPGDEVIVPGFTFVAPGNMVLAVGATPVFAEVEPDGWCLDPADVERCLTDRTKAIIAVHTYGNMCDMDALGRLASARGVALIEDAAEACFSRLRGRHAGTLSDIGCFSFQATKTISMGEGGFVATARPELHERMRLFRDHGMRRGKRYWHEAVGRNYRITNLQAALGVAQLERLDRIYAQRRHVFERYSARLQGQAGLTLQAFGPGVEPLVWAIAVRCTPAAFGLDRDAIMARLEADGIETRPGFYPFTVMPFYSRYVRRPLPVCEDVAAHVVSLPSYPTLTDDDIDFVCDRLLRLRRAPV